jgi:hypothetical protein
VNARELAQDTGIGRSVLGGALERDRALFERTQLIEPEPADAVVTRRAHAGVAGELGLALEHRDQVAKALLVMVQTLQRMDRRRGSRLGLERAIVELDGRAGVAAVGLDQPRARRDRRRAVTAVAVNRVGLALERAVQRFPGALHAGRTRDAADARGIVFGKLTRRLERQQRFARAAEHVFEQTSLLVLQLRAALGAVGQADLGLVERQCLVGTTE